jgi:flagellar M-ring protein FliF
MLPEKLKFKNTLEANLEKRAQSLLDRALGPGNSVVRVTANLDFTQEAITKEEFDPDSVVPRSESVTESKSGKNQSGGVPGVESNLKENSSANSLTQSSQTSEVTNYEISKTVRKIVNPVGKIKNISAAVLLSEKMSIGANGGQATTVPFSAEEMEAIRKMVASALGIDVARGDRIEVVSMPFSQKLLEAGATDSGRSVYDYLPYIKYFLFLVGAFFLYRLLVRPVITTLRAESTTYNKTVEELESEYAQDIKALDPPERLRRELAENSVTPTRVIRAWLNEGRG